MAQEVLLTLCYTACKEINRWFGSPTYRGTPVSVSQVVLVGPGNAGKTSLRRGLQGIAFQAERESTLGGEVHNITVRACHRSPYQRH